MKHLPEIGSVVNMDGSEQERAAKLLSTFFAYLTQSTDSKGKKWQDVHVNANHFLIIYSIVRNGIRDKKNDNAITLTLAKFLLENLNSVGILNEE